MNGQGHFLTIFCLWSHLFLTFASYHQSPVAILIQPRDLCAMVRGWTPGMTPRYNSLPRQKKFRHDNTIRSLTIWTEEKWLGFTQEVLTWNISLDNFRFWLWNSLKNQFPIDKHNIDNHSRNNTNLNRNYKWSSIKDIFTFFQGLLFWKKVFHF